MMKVDKDECVVVSLGAEDIFRVDIPIGQEAAPGLRAKFAVSQQQPLIESFLAGLSNGQINVGTLSRNEIQVTAMRRVYTHRFGTEFQTDVLMPRRGKEPLKAAFAGYCGPGGFYPGAATLPIKSPDEIGLIRLYRYHGFFHQCLDEGKGWRVECPRGNKRPAEELEKTAFREAQEEAGIVMTEKSEVVPLGFIEPNSGWEHMVVPLYAVTNVDFDPAKVNLDVSEAPTALQVLSVDRAFEMVESSEIIDSFSIAMLFRAYLKGLIRAKNYPK
jgi:8-oxo-dGTP pyrophosphatase MutT (NUDIX family)